jgi:hypothetical protein
MRRLFMIKEMFTSFKDSIQNKKIFFIALTFMIVGFFVSFLYYSGTISADRISLILWMISIVLIVFSFYNKSEARDPELKKLVFLILGVSALYFVSHLWNFNAAPWNSNGLFDDAAWDIKFVLEMAQSNSSSLIVKDTLVSGISRELVFHHYIGIWFQLFGYNLLIFNVALIFLGYITVLFTSLLAFRIFRSYTYAAIAAILINFLPLHFTQVFMGHRYAICAPLMMISLYFLYYGYQKRSVVRIAVGGVFAGICLESAIMGKQYIYALLGALILFFIINLKRKDKLKEIAPLFLTAAVSFIVAVIPLISFFITNPALYTMRESMLISEFLAKVKTDGVNPLLENIKICSETFFAGNTYQRQFMNAYPIIPYLFLPFILIGTVISIVKKHYYISLMILIPVIGSFVVICFDFRVLISAPFYVLSVVFALSWLGSLIKPEKLKYMAVLSATVLLVISPMRYIGNLSQDPNGQFMLPHTSVAASRFIQDIAAGETNPKFTMKFDEFDRTGENSKYDTLAATRNSFAHVNTFLHNFDSRRILNLLDNFPYAGKALKVLHGFFKKAIDEYKPAGKDLMIVLEKGEEITGILDALSAYDKKMIVEYKEDIDGSTIEMFTIRIPSASIADFKAFVAKMKN